MKTQFQLDLAVKRKLYISLRDCTKTQLDPITVVSRKLNCQKDELSESRKPFVCRI